MHTCTPVGVESTSPASAWLCQQLIDADIRHLFKYPHLLAICHPGWHLYNRIGYGVSSFRRHSGSMHLAGFQN